MDKVSCYLCKVACCETFPYVLYVLWIWNLGNRRFKHIGGSHGVACEGWTFSMLRMPLWRAPPLYRQLFVVAKLSHHTFLGVLCHRDFFSGRFVSPQWQPYPMLIVQRQPCDLGPSMKGVY